MFNTDFTKIASDWFKIGNGNNDDFAFKFIAYFIAFNAIYVKFALNSNKDDENDAEKIELLCKNYKGKSEISLGKLILKNEELKGSIDYITSEPVLSNIWYIKQKGKDGKTYKRNFFPAENEDEMRKIIASKKPHPFFNSYINYLNFKDAKDAEDESTQLSAQLSALLKNIFIIRNNLFHGSKSPYAERDILLVQHSSCILEACLRAIIEDK